jgi:hypothetical protein
MLYCPEGLVQALDELHHEEDCAELSQVRALMLWLAWDCGMDERKISPKEYFKESTEDPRDLECLLHLSPAAVIDFDAMKNANEAICPEAYSMDTDWLETHLKWGNTVLAVRANPMKARKLKRVPLVGDIVYRNVGVTPALTVVLESNQGRVVLADSEEKKFATKYVTVVDLPCV